MSKNEDIKELVLEVARDIIVSAIQSKHYILDVSEFDPKDRPAEVGERFKVIVAKVNEAYHSVQ